MSQGHNFLPKFLFVSNLLKAMKIREQVPNDVVKPSASGGVIPHLRSLHRHTVEMLPMGQFTPAFSSLLQSVILDRTMQTSLEQENKLNWCKEVKSLVPLRTNGDGNCLLHAASQYMLGVQDTDLVLRKALYAALRDTDTRNFRMRFQTQLLQSQEFTQTGLRYSTLNWEEEWEKVVQMASPGCSRNGLQYDSLEDIHIFILANILRRPIIIIADQVVRSMKSGCSFSPLGVGGVYLPLHWPPGECYRYPIVLGYDSQHFAPLITVRDSPAEIRAVPLASPARGGFEELKAHFLLEKEQQQKSRLIGQYLSLLELPVTGPCLQATQIIHAARLDEGNLPEEMDLMEDYLQLVTHEYKRWEEDRQPCWPHPQRPPPFSVSQLSLVEIRCATPRCAYYVSVETQPHCHECFERRRAGEQGAEPSTGTTPSPRSAPPTAPSLSLYSETHAMKCKTAGCLFTLSVERQGLCERCYSARERPHDPPPLCSLCHQEAPHLSNGLCPVCLQWTARDRAGPTADSSQGSRAGGGDSSLSALHRQSTIGQPCKRSGCQYYGTPEKLGFCTICYVDYQTNHRPDSTAAPRLGPSSAALHSTPRCLSRDCNAPGLPMCEGYCNRCFVKEQGLRLHRAGVRAPRGPRSPTLGTRAAHLRQTQTQTRLQCSRSNCKNASAGWPELCSECQGRGGREGRRAHAHAHTHAHAHAHKDTPKTCRTQGCDHYANQDKQGYCNECDHFKQIYSP